MYDATKMSVQERLTDVGKGYAEFIRENGLVDANLARMTYLYATKKEYIEYPIDNISEQQSMLDHLDAWMKETETMMNAAMV